MINSQANIKEELATAIKNNEFVIYYQPQFNLNTTEFESVEALIRWQHPKLGLLLPGDFIPVAEEDENLIVPITTWVLKHACQQSKIWQAHGLPLIRVAVNVSEKGVIQKGFAESVLEILKETNLDTSYLEIELTENIIFKEDIIIQNILKLKNIGVTITLDDFGTGYSSISLLKKIPIDKIKIAKEFIDNIYSNQDDAAIVRAIIQLASSLNLQVVVEGVEYLKQLQLFLNEKGLEFQGFYFSEPLPPEEVEKFFIANKDKNY